MKIAVLLSGGVDSSVALRLLAAQGGHEITAFYLKIWLEDELAYLGECPWQEDLDFAREVCRASGVPLRVLSLQREYHEQVVRSAMDVLRQGGTPSPDILCNRGIKFGVFLDLLGNGYDRVASGHYARLERTADRCLLKRSPDPVKDQTYFLCYLRQDQLARALFPVGHLHKSEVRRLAREMGLPNRDRRDSQGICFLGRIHYDEFIRSALGERCGPIVEADSGRVLGRHRGPWFHTIGQRRGLNLGGGPWYVVGKDMAANVVYVAHREARDRRARNRFTVAALNWTAGCPAGLEPGAERALRLGVKLRHGPQIVPAAVRSCASPPAEAAAAGPRRLQVILDNPDPGLAPGQFAVFYDGETCLGGGVIEEPAAGA